MSQTLRQTIIELDARAKQYDLAAAKSRQAAQHLRELLQLDAPTGPSAKTTTAPAAKQPATARKPAPKKTVAKRKKATSTVQSNGKPTLVAAIAHVLETRRDANAGGVKAAQLYDEIHDAGYRFNGANQKNNIRYLYKILRMNTTRFIRSDDGTFSLKG
jgi:hypothetical protein